MKRILIFISALLLSSSVIFAQEADMKVGELLNTSGWFELERVYPAVAADVQTPMLKQMAEVMLASNLILEPAEPTCLIFGLPRMQKWRQHFLSRHRMYGDTEAQCSLRL